MTRLGPDLWPQYFADSLRQLLVILLGRMLPLLHSTSMPGSSILSPLVGEQQGTRRSTRNQPHHITIMHTMASRVRHSTLHCSAKSAEACGLREFFIDIKPPIKHLGHFHPDTSAPAGSRPDPNTRSEGYALVTVCQRPFPTTELAARTLSASAL